MSFFTRMFSMLRSKNVHLSWGPAALFINIPFLNKISSPLEIIFFVCVYDHGMGFFMLWVTSPHCSGNKRCSLTTFRAIIHRNEVKHDQRSREKTLSVKDQLLLGAKTAEALHCCFVKCPVLVTWPTKGRGGSWWAQWCGDHFVNTIWEEIWNTPAWSQQALVSRTQPSLKIFLLVFSNCEPHYVIYHDWGNIICVQWTYIQSFIFTVYMMIKMSWVSAPDKLREEFEPGPGIARFVSGQDRVSQSEVKEPETDQWEPAPPAYPRPGKWFARAEPALCDHCRNKMIGPSCRSCLEPKHGVSALAPSCSNMVKRPERDILDCTHQLHQILSDFYFLFVGLRWS